MAMVDANDKSITETVIKEDSSMAPPPPPPPPLPAVKKKRKGIVSRIWNGIFRHKGNDLEKRLKYIAKHEAAVLARLQRRSQRWRHVARQLIIFSVIFEVIAVVYAIMTTRSMDLDWKMRTFRILPMFVLPVISSAFYTAFVSFSRMRDRSDQKTLEKLRAERQAEIDELKERTNYYTTQQLIQRYDPDPAAKAAAATVLASKLGADSGLKFSMGDEPKHNFPTGKSHDAEVVPSSNLRNRNHKKPSRSTSMDMTLLLQSNEEFSRSPEFEGPQTSEHNQMVVNHHYPQSSTPNDGGWVSRIAALLVGEDPTQSYALICGNCHMHNGLARKEDFPYITYYCPHCKALNRPKQSDGVSGPVSPNINSLTTASSLTTAGGSGDFVNEASSLTNSVHASNSPVKETSEIAEAEKVASSDVVS